MPRREEWFCGTGLGPSCPAQSRDNVSHILVVPDPALAQMDPGIAWAIAPEGACCKLRQLLCTQVHRVSELWFGSLSLDFRGYMRKSLVQAEACYCDGAPHREPLLRECGGEMWSWKPHTESPVGHCLVELWKRATILQT